MDSVRLRTDDGAIILLVEDDPILRSTLMFSLTREGYKVIPAENGRTAIDAVDLRGPELSLIILDSMLPEVSGLQVLRHVRSRLEVPVLMLSARGEEQDKVDGLELGADDYVVKPFALRELLARIRAVVRRRAFPSAMRSGVLHRGDLQLEPDQHRATIRDVELQLRPKEFGLLMALAMEPGRVFGRHELLDLVWGKEVVVDERTVDVHISWLRGKLQAAGLQDAAIRTVYAAGYRFIQESTGFDQDVSIVNSGSEARTCV